MFRSLKKLLNNNIEQRLNDYKAQFVVSYSPSSIVSGVISSYRKLNIELKHEARVWALPP